MSYHLIGDADFTYPGFDTFPLVEHILGIGRMSVVPRFDVLDEYGVPMDDEDRFLGDLGNGVPQLWLPVIDDVVSLPSTADLDLVLDDLLVTLRTADGAICGALQHSDNPVSVRWSLPFVWELHKPEWPALLEAIVAVLDDPDPPTMEFFLYQDPNGLLERLLDPNTRLGRMRESLSETHGFGLAALAIAAANDLDVFSVEDQAEQHEYDTSRSPPALLERLESVIFTKTEEERIAQIRIDSEQTRAALDNGQIVEALEAACSARAWTWGVRDRAEIAAAYRASAAAWVEAQELDRAVTDASWSLQNEHSAEAYDTRAVALHIAGQIEAALDDYSLALDIDPDNSRILSNRADAYYDLGNDEACIADSDRAIAIEPNDPSPYITRGHAYMRVGQEDLARRDAAHAANLGDDSYLEELELT